MSPRRAAPSRRTRMTLAERKQETREALVFAALEAFARDGYHAASLEAIATEAGYSKGAVYSNFEGKAGLFLAVMDYNLDALRGEEWDPLEQPASAAVSETAGTGDDGVAALVRGFGLATLEFIATAARDAALTDALRQRVQVMIDGYAGVAAAHRSEDDKLAVDDVARLMAALDQGVSVLALGGISALDGPLLRAGLQRLVNPRRSADEPNLEAEDSPELPEVVRVRQLLADSGDS